MERIQQIQDLVFALCKAYGPSGDESDIGQQAKALLEPYCTHIETDSFGNVLAVVKQAKEGQDTILLDAHIDEIGLIVMDIDTDGFLRVSPVGGVDRRVLPAAAVTVFGKEPIQGVVCTLPPHLTKNKESSLPEIRDMGIDIGLNQEQARKLVKVGDRVSVISSPYPLLNNTITAKALDNRCGCAALIEVCRQVYNKDLNCGVCISLSSQEEVGKKGAVTSAYKIHPQQAISVDVSFAHSPGAPENKCGKLGGGPMIGFSPVLDQAMSNKLVQLAEEKSIAFQHEVMNGETGTTADDISLSREGVKMALVSIPLRYMHTPCEVVHLQDILSTADLIAEYLYNL